MKEEDTGHLAQRQQWEGHSVLRSQTSDLSGLQFAISQGRSTTGLSQRTFPALNNKRQDLAPSDDTISHPWAGGETVVAYIQTWDYQLYDLGQVA